MNEKELEIVKALIELTTTVISLAASVIAYKTVRTPKKKRKK
ncbi:MAG: hypothetical protein RR598_11550 [Anaerorhabdus sp.]|uniref:Uncharacterized protein n=1 Tax=Anaerorhabdus furcosa TaxID=118967 RepID=A0A1T4M2J9_9FIRM|nr:hypothetical protein [Anaerorhabdus furcosa]SJZ61151.1 hypothetical protein SAMN02745191_1154 [Anaerorhabdus furcosa]